MTQFLPPNLLALFAARDPIPYLPPTDKLPHEKKTRGYSGVGSFLGFFEVSINYYNFKFQSFFFFELLFFISFLMIFKFDYNFRILKIHHHQHELKQKKNDLKDVVEKKQNKLRTN